MDPLTESLTLQSHLPPDFLAEALRADVTRGLTETPKSLPPKWFYDERGSVLFEEITRLPEYYPTRAEREILVARAAEIAATTGARTLVELGSGSGEKTRLLIDALRGQGTLARYAPIGSWGVVSTSAARLVRAWRISSRLARTWSANSSLGLPSARVSSAAMASASCRDVHGCQPAGPSAWTPPLNRCAPVSAARRSRTRRLRS